ncbi:hypothetical protein ACN42_g1840 [Penicillium freii]|uniref:Uncharacterized protein n=1 Tax=Penicillium freii TaxID=48697 RepID=A0A101MR98_PENFR|nr:hypothetical protein ACN42_g1840 [Penicillium freii]
MYDDKIDDHDNDPPELGGYVSHTRASPVEGVNCFAKTVNSRDFRETWTGRKLKQGLQEPGYRRSTRTKPVER